MRVIIADTKTGKCYQSELPKEKESFIIGRKIGEVIDGGIFGAAGYTLELTGGSDNSGFPMRKDLAGQRKAKLLLSEGPGFNPSREGERRRKLVVGNTYSADIMQVNSKVVQAGATPLEQLFPKKEAEKKA